jgi:hypothetical protein
MPSASWDGARPPSCASPPARAHEGELAARSAPGFAAFGRLVERRRRALA